MNDEAKEIVGQITVLLSKLDSISDVTIAKKSFKRFNFPDVLDIFFKEGEEKEKEFLDFFVQEAKEYDEKTKQSAIDITYKLSVANVIMSSIYGVGSAQQKYVSRLKPVVSNSSFEIKARRVVKEYNEYREYHAIQKQKKDAAKAVRLEREVLRKRLFKLGIKPRMSKSIDSLYQVVLYDARILAHQLGLQTEDENMIFVDLHGLGYCYKDGDFERIE